MMTKQSVISKHQGPLADPGIGGGVHWVLGGDPNAF